MDDNQEESLAPDQGMTLAKAQAYAQNPGAIVDAIGDSIGGSRQKLVSDVADNTLAVNPQATAADMEAAQKQADFTVTQAESAAPAAGSLVTNFKTLPTLNADHIATLEKLGFAPSSPLAVAYQKATGRILPVVTNGLKASGYAEGGGVGAGFDPDAYLSQGAQQAPPQQDTGGFDPDSYLKQANDEQFGTPGQMAITAAEKVAQGYSGPIGPFIEKKLLHVPVENIRARAEANPITAGVGEAAGLAGGMLTGTGEAALMGKAGEIAQAASGLGHAAEGASLGFKVGSEAVKQAAEMAVLQSGDEVSKRILSDPKASAESAMANIGLSAALGGTLGAFGTGVISPIWSATAGPKVEQVLSAVKNHLNGAKLLMPEEAENAIKTLGIDVDPVTRAGLSQDPRAMEPYSLLREAKHKGVMEGIENLQKDASDSVSNSLGIAPEDIAVHSENEAGHELYDTFKKEYTDKYEPIANALDKRNSEAANISIPDEDRLSQYGRIIENGMKKVGTDSPAYKLYNDYGNRLLAKETIGGVDQLKTEIGNEIKKAIRAGDMNTSQALQDIRGTLSDFQEGQIARQGRSLEKAGVEGAEKNATDLLNERAETNRRYKEFAKMSDQLAGHLDVGGFSGANGLMSKLADKVSAEQLLKKFSFKGNADFIPFLQEHFPEVLEKVKENELKRFLKPAVLSAKGEQPMNIKKLGDIIDKAMAGQKEYVQAIMPQGSLEKIQAAKDLMNAIPQHQSSGTAGWMTKMYQHMPASGLAAVGMLTGHNPIFSAILGETAQRLGVSDMPNAMRLGYLKFLASEQPVKAEGFRSMVDYMHNAYKGENTLAKATKNVFKAGTQVLMENQYPDSSDREKLDKKITQLQDKPEQWANQNPGHLAHYLPDHQVAVTGTTTAAMQYLQQLKPKPTQLSPLDTPIPPSKAEEARYHRALDIAQQPALVLQHMKDGTLQTTDLTDLHMMYPSVYQQMAQKLTEQMSTQHAGEAPIPYRTRMGLSLFLGQPMDSTMTPSSIVAAQPKPVQPKQTDQNAPMKGRKGSGSLGKSNSTYNTPEQSAERDRASRD